MSKQRDRLEEFKRTFESGDPLYNATPEVVATMHRATAELKASGIENAALTQDFITTSRGQACSVERSPNAH